MRGSAHCAAFPALNRVFKGMPNIGTISKQKKNWRMNTTAKTSKNPLNYSINFLFILKIK